jgi:hypothetical protein
MAKDFSSTHLNSEGLEHIGKDSLDSTIISWWDRKKRKQTSNRKLLILGLISSSMLISYPIYLFNYFPFVNFVLATLLIFFGLGACFYEKSRPYSVTIVFLVLVIYIFNLGVLQSTFLVTFFLISEIYFVIMDHLKKFWYALAFTSFFLGLWMVYNLIWIGLDPNDSSVFLIGSNGAIVNNIDVNSHSLGFGEVNITTETCAYVSTSCIPADSVFEKGSTITCVTNVKKSDNPKCEKFFNSTYSLLERGLVCNEPFDSNDFFKTCTITPIFSVINGSGQFTYPLTLLTDGIVYVQISDLYLPAGEVQKNFQNKDSFLYDVNVSYGGARGAFFYVKSQSEVRNLRNNRSTQFILALLALCGVFTAAYYLQKLWENKE